MRYFDRLVKEFSFLSVGSILTLAAGFVTFPVWTRLFSVEEYGQLSLVIVTITLICTISKGGLQHSATRYFSILAESKEGTNSRQSYYTTIFLSVIAIAGVVCVSAYYIIRSAGPTSLRELPAGLMIIAVCLGFGGGLRQLVEAFLLVEAKARVLTIYSIVLRYGGFLISLVFVLYVFGGLIGFFSGQLLLETAALGFLVVPYFAGGEIRAKTFSPGFLWEALKYGLPLLGFEMSRTLLSLGDRYLIDYFLGAREVGLYSASYNLCMYAISTFTMTLQNVLTPIYFSIWEKEGREETERFLRGVLKYFLYFSLGVLLLFVACGEDLILLLASEKYREGSRIMPIVAPSLVLNGSYFILGAGLYIERKSLFILGTIVFATSLNILLNILLIPGWGLTGAAIATLLAYLAFVLLVYLGGRRTVKIGIDLSTIGISLGAGCAMAGVLWAADLLGWGLVVKVLGGGVVYLAALAGLDESLRGIVRDGANRLMGRN